MTNALAALLLPFLLASPDPKALRVSAVPDESPAELRRKFEPLGAYLSKSLGRPIEFEVLPDYAAAVESFAAKKLDLVWFGGFTFVQARRRTASAIPLVQREEDTSFHTDFIVPADSPARKLSDLKGKRFAFGSVSSTSGHLMPRHFLLEAGIDPDRDFSSVSFTGAHDETARRVATKEVDGGAINRSVLEKLTAARTIDPAKVRVVWTTPPYVDYNWTVRGDLEPEVIDRIRRAFLALDYENPAHRTILDSQRTRKFVPTSLGSYETTEEVARRAGLIGR